MNIVKALENPAVDTQQGMQPKSSLIPLEIKEDSFPEEGLWPEQTKEACMKAAPTVLDVIEKGGLSPVPTMVLTDEWLTLPPFEQMRQQEANWHTAILGRALKYEDMEGTGQHPILDRAKQMAAQNPRMGLYVFFQMVNEGQPLEHYYQELETPDTEVVPKPLSQEIRQWGVDLVKANLDLLAQEPNRYEIPVNSFLENITARAADWAHDYLDPQMAALIEENYPYDKSVTPENRALGPGGFSLRNFWEMKAHIDTLAETHPTAKSIQSLKEQGFYKRLERFQPLKTDPSELN